MTTVKIETTYKDGSVSTGSGFLTGLDDIVTAAHVVYGDVDAIRVIHEGVYYLADLEFMADYDTSARRITIEDVKEDVAKLTVNVPIGLDLPITPIDWEYEGHVVAEGFPNGGPFTPVDLFAQDRGDYYELNFPNDLWFGHSGGPIKSSEGATAVVSTMGWAPDLDSHRYWLEDMIEDKQEEWVLQELYEFTLDRKADVEGFVFWLDVLKDSGVDKTVDWFVPEGKTNEYVTQKAYEVFLDRQPDQEGYDFWLNALDNGYSQKDFIVGMIEVGYE